MARRGLIGLALALLFAPAALADPHGHAAPQFENVTKTVTVEGSAVKIESLTCPDGFTYVAPRWNVTSGKGFVIPVAPTGNGFSFLLNNAFDSSQMTVEISIVCMKPASKPASQAKGDSHVHEIRQAIESKPLVLPGRGEFTQANVACPNGSSAINGYLESDRRARTELSLPSADGKSWDFGISNLTNDAETNATARVQCIDDRTGPAQRLKKKKDCKKIKNRAKRRKCRNAQRKQKRHDHEVEREVVEQKVPVESSPTPQEDGIAKEGSGSCPVGTFPVGIGWNFLGHPFTGLNQFQQGSGQASAAGLTFADAVFVFTIFNRSTELEAILQTICLGTKTGRAG